MNLNFSNRVDDYSIYAKIQKNVANKISSFALQLSDLDQSKKTNILDIGSGTSFVAKNFIDKRGKFNFYEVDLSFSMLKTYQFSSSNYVKICADFENLPFDDNSFDLIISSFSLQWATNFEKIFANLNKILKSGGLVALAFPTSKSFNNFNNLPFRINKMPEIFFINSLLEKNNFVKKKYYEEVLFEEFSNPIEALKSFKKIGANNPFTTGENSLNKFAKARIFYLKNYQTNLLFRTDWVVSYFIYSKNV